MGVVNDGDVDVAGEVPVHIYLDDGLVMMKVTTPIDRRAEYDLAVGCPATQELPPRGLALEALQWPPTEVPVIRPGVLSMCLPRARAGAALPSSSVSTVCPHGATL